MSGRTTVRRTIGRGLPELPQDRELVIYRVAQEALTNVVRHAHAATAELSLCKVGDKVVLTVSDDGRGSADLVAGAGISGMRERALLVGADLSVTSTPGRGTTVRLEVDLVILAVADEDPVKACRTAIRGQAFVYPGAMSALVRDYLDRLNRGESLPRTVLTEREDEVLKLIAEGHSTREIARELTISYKTVERHRENILAKLGLRDRTQVTRYAIRAGLIEP